MASRVGTGRKDGPLGPSASESNAPSRESALCPRRKDGPSPPKAGPPLAEGPSAPKSTAPGRKDGPFPPKAGPPLAEGPSAPKGSIPSQESALSAPSALPRRKPRPRIGSFAYRGPYAYHIILLTQGRSPHLADSPLTRRCMDHLKRTAERLGFRLLAFSLMPDHLHALVLGRHEAADLIRFVQRFKQITAFDFKRETGLRLWQQSFYDRALRIEEDVADVAAYILGNPARAGLAVRPGEYALSGGEYAEADGAADGAEAPSLRPSPLSAVSPAPGGPHG